MAGAAVLPVVFVVVSKPSGAVLVKLTDHPSSLLWRKETQMSFVPGSNSSVVIQCSSMGAFQTQSTLFSQAWRAFIYLCTMFVF